MKVIIICVNYNTYPELDGYLLSISNSAKEVKEVVEVSVAVADNTPMELRKSFGVDYPHITVLPYILESNDGYLGSAEVVMSDLRKSGSLEEYDYCVISNVDLRLSQEFFKELISTPIAENVGWIAPEIYTASRQSHENPFMLNRPKLWRLYFWIFLYKFPKLFTIYFTLGHAVAKNKTVFLQEMPIYAGHGSIMIFAKSFIINYHEGQFPAFMYGEEIYLAELVRRANLITVFKPNIIVNNIGGASSSKLSMKRMAKMSYIALTALQKMFFTSENK